MPYKYIGRTTNFSGKTLWEIVGNLKNYGVGRIVVRNVYQRYPEPTYLKILRVETLPNPEVVTLDNVRKVRVWTEKTWRGKTEPKPIVIESTSYKADYRLIPKDEEYKYCKPLEIRQDKVLPKYMPFPPLMKELILRDTKALGGNFSEEPKLEIVYNIKSMKKKYRIAEDGEEPTVKATIGLGTPAAPNLYEGIQL